MEHLWQDVRYGVRQLANQRGFTAVAVLTLALGIGANVAIFNTLDALFLKMLPVERPQEIVQIHSDAKGNTSFSNPLWEQVRDRQDIFIGAFAWTHPTFNLADGGEIRSARGMYVSGDYFPTLGVRPYRGRLLGRDDDRRGGATSVALLSYDFWKKEYGGREDAVGGTVRLDGHIFSIVGITPPRFFGMTVGNNFDVAVPLASEPTFRGENSSMNRNTSWWLRVAARLRPGVNAAQADAHLQAISAASFEATSPQNRNPDYVKRIFKSSPAGTGISGLRRTYRQAMWVLMGVVAMVLLIACANIANLLLARAAVRKKEMGVRLALGASRRRLIQQLLTESLLIAAMGTALAFPLASAASHLLVQQIATSNTVVFLDLVPDGRVIAFVAGIALLTTMFFGLAPALNATRVSLADAMKQAGPGPSERRGRFGLSRMLVVAQVAISMVLLAGAGLLMRSFQNLTSVDTGFEPERVLVAILDVRRTQATKENRAILYKQIVEAVGAVPGVTATSHSGITPVSGSAWNGDIEVPSLVSKESGPKGSSDAISFFNDVAPQYFTAMGTRLIAGRDFTPQDSFTAPKVAIVNEAFAKKFFPGQNPVGQQYFQGGNGGERKVTTIVGLVENAKYQTLREEPLVTAYVPVAQNAAGTSTNLVVRVAAAPSRIIPQVRAAIEKVSPQTFIRFRTLETQLADSLRQDRLLALLSGIFGGLALLLSAIGLYGLLAHSVARRRREIGIRMALGSTPQRILRLILGDGVRLAIAGVVVGVLAAIATTRVLTTFLFGITAGDPATMTVVGLLLVAVATAACSGAARRAARIEPYAAIRHE